MGGGLPFRSGVVVSLRPLSVCRGSMWLVPALFPSLSVLPSMRTLTVGPGFSLASCLPFALLRALGILVPVASLLH